MGFDGTGEMRVHECPLFHRRSEASSAKGNGKNRSTLNLPLASEVQHKRPLRSGPAPRAFLAVAFLTWHNLGRLAEQRSAALRAGWLQSDSERGTLLARVYAPGSKRKELSVTALTFCSMQSSHRRTGCCF